MILIPEVESFIRYIETRGKIRKSDIELLRQNIFENHTSKFVFDINFINSVEEIIDEDSEYRDESNMYLKSLIDGCEEDLSIHYESELSSTDSDLIFENLCNYTNGNCLMIGISESKEELEDFKNILNLNNVVKVNKNFILSKLIANEVCQIRHTNIENNQDIIQLLEFIYNLYNNIENVIIIDRQANLNHNLYDGLIEKTPLFKYYKLYANGTDAIAIKAKLLNYELYSTNDEDLIHERNVIFNDLIITLDEDPFNIEHRSTWIITIEISQTTVTDITNNKCNAFAKTLF